MHLGIGTAVMQGRAHSAAREYPVQSLKAHLLLVLDLRHGAGLDPVDLLGRRGILVPEGRGAQSCAGIARLPQIRPVAQVVRLVLGMREVRQVVQAQLRARVGPWVQSS